MKVMNYFIPIAILLYIFLKSKQKLANNAGSVDFPILPDSHYSVQDKIDYLLGQNGKAKNWEYVMVVSADWKYRCPSGWDLMKRIYSDALDWAKRENVSDHPLWTIVEDEGFERFNFNLTAIKTFHQDILNDIKNTYSCNINWMADDYQNFLKK